MTTLLLSSFCFSLLCYEKDNDIVVIIILLFLTLLQKRRRPSSFCFSLLCYEEDDSNCHRLLLIIVVVFFFFLFVAKRMIIVLSLFCFCLVCCEENDGNNANKGVVIFLLVINFSFCLLPSTLDGVPFKEKIAHVYGSSPLEKVFKSILLFTKVWICMIIMGIKKKLKKVGYDWERSKFKGQNSLN